MARPIEPVTGRPAPAAEPHSSLPAFGEPRRRKLPAAARVALRGLERLQTGRLTVRLPDGSTREVGEADGFEAEILVHRWRFFPRLLRGGDIGAGESYMDGEWSTPDLVNLTRLFLANEEALAPPRLVGAVVRLRDRVVHALRANHRRRARQNIRAHYDLSNDFYRLFLDPTLTYSAACFEQPGSGLEAAQRAKYARLARWAGLTAGGHVLEIGCGWGGFAEFAATEIGCRVTGITLSEAQARSARRRMAECGLADRVDIRIVDYRDVDGSYDAIVSIEMLEAVGHRYLDAFFGACDRLLRPDGRLILQSITIPDQVYDRYRRSSDWIRKHIFPGGHLPSLGAVQSSLRRQTDFVIERLDSIGQHYAATLSHWRRRFWDSIDEVRALGFDERFIRMWDFYLATCEAAFLQHQIDDLQIALRRRGRSELVGNRDRLR